MHKDHLTWTPGVEMFKIAACYFVFLVQVLLWISDGGDKHDNFDMVRERNTDARVRVFTFLVGQPLTVTGDDPTKGLRQVACDNRGVFYTVNGPEPMQRALKGVSHVSLVRIHWRATQT